MQAMCAAEVVRLALVLVRTRGFIRIHGHPTDGIQRRIQAAVPPAYCNRRAKSVADCGRSSGSFERACMIAAEIRRGSPNEAGSGGGSSYRCLLMTPETVSPPKGRSPETIS